MAPRAATVPATDAVERLGDRRARPRVNWVARLTGATASEVETELRGVDRHLREIEEIRRRHREGGRSFYAQIRSPFDLYALTRLLRPASVVETGVSSGVSSAHFLLGLQDNRHGRLYSIDLPERQESRQLRRDESPVCLPPGRATGWAVPARLRRRWELRLGPSQRLLPEVARRAAPIGIFLHDSLHTPGHLTFELETIRPYLRPGAVVLADNTAWTGKAFDRFARSLGVPVIRNGRSDLVGLRVPTETARATGRGRAGRPPTTR